MGIGKGINRENLRLIAGVEDDEDDKNRVVQVKDFDELLKKIDDIKNSACSGKLTSKKPKTCQQLKSPVLSC